MQKLQCLVGVLPVKVAGRFVCQQDCGLVDEASRDGDPLLLPAGQFPGVVGEPVGKAKGRNEPVESGRVGFLAVQEDWEQDIFAHVQGRYQVIELIDKTYFPAAEDGKLFQGQGGDIGVLYIDIAVRRAVYAAEHVQQRGFPGAGGADHGGKAAAFYGEGYVVEGCDGARALAVGFCEVAASEYFHDIIILSICMMVF